MAIDLDRLPAERLELRRDVLVRTDLVCGEIAVHNRGDAAIEIVADKGRFPSCSFMTFPVTDQDIDPPWLASDIESKSEAKSHWETMSKRPRRAQNRSFSAIRMPAQYS